jgi:hypothetical protein
LARQADTALGQGRISYIRAIAAIGLAVVAALLVWLLLIRDNSESSTSSQASANGVTRAGLQDFAAAENHPVYWAGPRGPDSYELTKTPDGRIYVRYLPPGEEVGVQKPFLTVGTYPYANAYAATKAVARNQEGSIKIPVNNGVAFYTSSQPTSVYYAEPRSPVQVEIFSPEPGQARRLVASGQIRPVR